MTDSLESEICKHVITRRRDLQTISQRQNRNIRNTRNDQEIINICTRQIQKDPSHTKALTMRAQCYLKLSKLESTIQDCNQIININPSLTEAYYIRGCAYERLGEIDQSIQDYTTVLQLDPSHINAAYARGACQNMKGNFNQAIDDYMMALERDTDRPTSPPPIKRGNQNYYLDQIPTIASPQNESSQSTPRPSSILSTQANEHEELFRQAMEARKQGRFEIALNLFNQSLEIYDGDYKAWFYSALVCDKLNLLKEAESRYSKSIEIKSDNPLVYYNRGIVKQKLNKSQQAYQDFHTAVQQQPNKPEFIFNRGFSAARMRKFTQAINDFTQVIQMTSSYKAFYQRGLCYESLENFEEAEEDYLQSLALNSADINPLEALCLLYLKLQREQELLELIEEAASDFKSVDLTRVKGKVLFKMEIYNEALEELLSFPNDQNSDRFKIIGDCYIALDNYSEAVAALSKAIQLNPENTDYIYTRALAYRRQEKYEEAIQDYTVQIQIKQSQKGYLSRGFCYLKLNRNQEAILDYNTALKQEPTMHGYYNRGLAHMRLKSFQQALDDFSKALEMEPNHPGALYNKGYCYEALGNLDEAIQEYSKALANSNN